MQERIPYLGCLWNDVLFMSAVPPQDFCAAYYAAGFPRRGPMRFFRIDTDALESANLSVLTRMGVNEPKEYLPYRPADLPSYARIPQETHAYWEEEKVRGNDRPFLWMHVPHILYKGSIDASGLEIIEL